MTARRDGAIEYSLGTSERETERLVAQGAQIDELTRDLFTAAGIRPGMSVLDLGSGAGDSTLAARAVVGETGRVVGVDITPASLVRARQRVADAAITNVSFIEADLTRDFTLDEDFDAIVGRLVLMYLPNRTELLMSLMPRLRPGGIVAFAEVSIDGGPTEPRSETWDRLESWWLRALEANGTEVRMAMKLRGLLTRCGFTDIEGWSFLGNLSDIGGLRNRLAIGRSMLPIMRRYDVAPAEELDRYDEYEAATLREVEESGSIVINPTASDLWARKPL